MIVPVGSRVEVFTNTGTRKGFYQAGSGDYLGCEFILNESGCQNAILKFAGYADIEKTDLITIQIFDSNDNYFYGVVRQIPLDGSTKQDYTYLAYGLNDYFIRLNTQSQTYSGVTIRSIVLDLLDTIIVPNSPITKNLSKIDTLSVGVTTINFKYVSIKQAMQELQKLANSDGFEYRVGVDADGEFFFKRRGQSTIATLVTGARGDYGIEEYQPKETKDAISKLYVLKKDGTFFGTYISTEDIDIFEKKLTASDIADADIDAWANGQLLILERENREAQIDWQIKTENPFLIMADNNIRIISNIPPTQKENVDVSNYGQYAYGSGPYGGYAYSGNDVDDTLQIKQVKYTVNDKQGYMNLQLGNLPIEFDREVIAVNQDLQDLRVSLGR